MSTTRLLATIFALFGAGLLHAQQLSVFTQYREHNTLLNPAAVSSDFLAFEHNVAFRASHRSQWTDLEGAPRTSILQGEYMSTELQGVNFIAGGHLITDQTGPTGVTGAAARFAGIISDDPYERGISVGLTAGMMQYAVRTDELRLKDEGDIDVLDNQKQGYPDVGFGVFAYTSIGRDDGYVYAGASVPQVLGLDLTFQDENGEFLVQRVRHIYGQLGLIRFLRDGSFIEPTVWVKYAPNAPVNLDLNLRYQFAQTLWTGIGVSSSKTAHIEAGLYLGDNVDYYQNLKIGYAFDYSFSSFGPSVGGTHELNVAFSFAQ